ncbi:LexA-binding, inner membrane-associated putative hydrolase [Stigmatella aurantiaca]|uniref:LexA-binding, inner membrane-associated putative hydrolase n=1 Tax=Stigmatella aurantiaca TaxID=41 RepID=A0A1H8B7J0_STIAU|nr:metal-dependent hydrolase [Stigmatella aurantiaca]SEM78925.1 LexA-binding, inner membrane-associated putative hydrolase [Stigmatella aurantiaca]
MNPLVHAELSWLGAQGLRERRDRILVTCAGLAPDLDGLSLLGGEAAYARYHHVLFHGYAGALLTAAVCAAFARQRLAVALLSLATFHLHLLCDLLGSGPGWGIVYFWPTSPREFFWRGQWDLASWQNALVGLGASLACLACALRWRRTVVELLSPRWDAEVTRTVRRRFLGSDDPSV